MKILFYLYQYPGLGGIETVTTLLANYLYDKGIEICFFSEKAEEIKMPLNPSIKFFHPKQQNLSESLKSVLVDENIDLVVLHDNYDADAKTITEVLRALQIPLLVQEHSDPTGTIIGAKKYIQELKMNSLHNILWRIKNFNYISRITKKYLHRKSILIKASYKYIILSQRFINSLEKCCPNIDVSKIYVINNPLTVPLVTASLCNKKKEVVFISRFEGVKGIDRMLSIFAECAAHNKDWSFCIYGDGSQRYLVEEVAKKQNNVIYKGIAYNVAEVLETASILVMTSSFEGWGLVLTEAMANGCIPMAFNSYLSVKDIIDDGDNGILVTPFNLNEYCRKLQALINSDEQRTLMATKCISKAKLFDISGKIGKQWVDIIESVLKHENSDSKH